MKKNILYVSLLSLFGLSFSNYAFAICPVCSIAVGAGVGFSRWLGVDDLITGLWIGALIVSMTVWTIDWFKRKNIKFKFSGLIVTLFYYAITLVPLYYGGIIGQLNPFFLIFDKLTVGIIVGSIVFLLVSKWYLILKEKNGGHAYFPFQKVVMPIGSLTILSFIIYLLIK